MMQQCSAPASIQQMDYRLLSATLSRESAPAIFGLRKLLLMPFDEHAAILQRRQQGGILD